MPNAEDLQEALKPLDDDEIDAILAPLRHHNRLLLAVSGGADSLALMILCAEWQTRCDNAPEILVASVDHGLRPDAASECAYVARLAEERGLRHTTLVWNETPTEASLQTQAREARYRLLAEHARQTDCSAIGLAHHLDDQAETLIMRLIRGSGVTGLGAMRAEQPHKDLSLLRPLLAVPKSRLMASLRARDLNWIEDPSNQSKNYLRVRVRGLLPELAKEGCDAHRLAATAHRMQRADDTLSTLAEELFQKLMRKEPGRALSFDPLSYAGCLEELRLRLCRMMLVEVAGAGYPPREERLVSLDAALCSLSGGAYSKRTVGGCCFEWARGRVWVYREPGREAKKALLASNGSTDWQGLYDIMLLQQPAASLSEEIEPARSEVFHIQPLGAEGRLMLRQAGLSFPHERWGEEEKPVALIEALPSLWSDGQPCFVVDWPELVEMTGIGVDVKEKNTKFMA
ncbi:tRNA lysidine(34) synthetase TilS [uncultured Cohaesibacter sp.]|uniref:tRNA lysidine(34) synthetase TilS n=1 Tax=uncultured Cohaesibacter sp. TaxID=1002546 RepID=UPI0029C6722D|nr:tRNA lysidine(34) synthetase TilS [uncultured Cohaesibacter sp.]